MRRREFLGVLGSAAAAWPPAARAQQAERVRRIGVLVGYPEDHPEIRGRLAALRQELQRLGWSEGRNVQIDVRAAAGSAVRFQQRANELVASQPDVLLAHTTPAAAALHRETRTIPIVFVNVSDPIGAGLIASLARPGGNITGLMQYEAGIFGKWLAMLKEIAPKIARVALLANAKLSGYDYLVRAAEAAAPSLAIELVPSPIANAADVKHAIESLARVPASGLVVPPDATAILHRDLIIALAARHRMPAVYPFRLFVAVGGLMSYGTDQIGMFGHTASYIDHILRGTSPADLPVQAPTKYETILNLKVAKAIGLTVPPSLLVRADEVIE